MIKSVNLRATGIPWLLLGVWLGGGCTGSAVMQSLQPVVQLEMQGSVEGNADQTPRVTATTSESAVVTGVISTPNPCYTFDAGIAVADETLVMTITANSRGGMCAAVVGSFTYRATIGGLSPGSFPVRIVHTYPGTGWEDRTFELRLLIS